METDAILLPYYYYIHVMDRKVSIDTYIHVLEFGIFLYINISVGNGAVYTL